MAAQKAHGTSALTFGKLHDLEGAKHARTETAVFPRVRVASITAYVPAAKNYLGDAQEHFHGSQCYLR